MTQGDRSSFREGWRDFWRGGYTGSRWGDVWWRRGLTTGYYACLAIFFLCMVAIFVIVTAL